MIPNWNAVKVMSRTDCRKRTLLPDSAEARNNDQVMPITADKPMVCRLACGSVPYFKLGCIDSRFGRLNTASRELVVSLYRAIIERFFIMRSRGLCTERPVFRRLLGLCFLTETKVGNCYEVCFAEAVLNMRRSFGGGYFKPMVKGVIRELIAATTAQMCSFGVSTALGGNGSLFCKGAPGGTWCDLLGNWLHDMSWRKDSALAWNCLCGGFPSYNKVILRSVLCAYQEAQRNGFVCDADCFAAWVCNQSCVLCFKDEPLGNFSGYGNCWADALFFCECGNCIEFGDRFYLPALALALRILSVWNVQTLKRTFDVRTTAIKHVKMHAERHIKFTWNRMCVESCTYSQEVVCLPEVTFEAHGRNESTPINMPNSVAYMRIDFCDSRNPCHIIRPAPGDEIRYYPDGGAPINCGGAYAAVCAIWPCFDKVCVCYLINAGAAPDYPAKWAWCEGDICEAYATGFVGTTCLPVRIPGLNHVFRAPINGFGGWKRAIDVSVEDVAAKIGALVAERSNGQLNGFPVSAGKASSYFGELCGGGEFVCYEWSYINMRYTYLDDTLVACYCGTVLGPIYYCSGFCGYRVARVSSGQKSYQYSNKPFGLSRTTIRFGGTFFETYKFNNRAAIQGE